MVDRSTDCRAGKGTRRLPRLLFRRLRHQTLARSVRKGLTFVDRLGCGGNKVLLVRWNGRLAILKVALTSKPKRLREISREQRLLTCLGGSNGFPELMEYTASSSITTRFVHFLSGFGFTGHRAILREYVEGFPLTRFQPKDIVWLRELVWALHEAGLAGLDYSPGNFIRTPDRDLRMVDFLTTSGGVERAEGEIFEQRKAEDLQRLEGIECELELKRQTLEQGKARGIDLSTVIVNWNTRDLLRGCLRSLRENTGDVVPEIFVVDNGSTDGSPEMVGAEFPGVSLIRNRANLGFARAANQGLHRAAGRHYLLLNSDTKVLPGALREMVDFMDCEENAAACGPQLVHEDGRPQNSVANFPTLATELLNKSMLRFLFPRRYPRKTSEESTPREVESVIGAAMMVRAEAVKEVGLLDEDYFFFLEETDWCYRFRARGWRVYQVPTAKVVHLQGKSAEKVQARARIEYFRSRYTYFRKHRGILANALLSLMIPLRLIINVAGNGIISVGGMIPCRARERLRIYGKILFWHLRGCPEDWGLRPNRRGERIGMIDREGQR